MWAVFARPLWPTGILVRETSVLLMGGLRDHLQTRRLDDTLTPTAAADGPAPGGDGGRGEVAKWRVGEGDAPPGQVPEVHLHGPDPWPGCGEAKRPRETEEGGGPLVEGGMEGGRGRVRRKKGGDCH